jgi:hypothetical protein
MFVETLWLHKMFLHQLTPNSIARLNLYFWLAKTCHFQPSAENITFVHRVHYQPKIIAVMTDDGTEGDAEAKYGCYNFTYQEIVSSPVTAYKKNGLWIGLRFLFYHKVSLDINTQSHPLVTDKIRNLVETPLVDVEDTEDCLAFVAMLQEVLKVYGTLDITKEYVACYCWPLKADWSIKSWLPEAQ